MEMKPGSRSFCLLWAGSFVLCSSWKEMGNIVNGFYDSKCTCVHVHMQLHVSAHTYEYVCTYTHVNMFWVCNFICVNVTLSLCVSEYMCACVYECTVCACICVILCAWMQVCMCFFHMCLGLWVVCAYLYMIITCEIVALEELGFRS